MRILTVFWIRWDFLTSPEMGLVPYFLIHGTMLLKQRGGQEVRFQPNHTNTKLYKHLLSGPTFLHHQLLSNHPCNPSSHSCSTTEELMKNTHVWQFVQEILNIKGFSTRCTTCCVKSAFIYLQTTFKVSKHDSQQVKDNSILRADGILKRLKGQAETIQRQLTQTDTYEPQLWAFPSVKRSNSPRDSKRSRARATPGLWEVSLPAVVEGKTSKVCLWDFWKGNQKLKV